MKEKFKKAADALNALKRGDESVLNEIYSLVSIMANFTDLSKEDREDVIQLTVIKVWEKASSFKWEDRYAWAWIKRIFNSQKINFITRYIKKNFDSLEGLVCDGKGHLITGYAIPDTEEAYLNKEESLKISEVMDNLKDPYKDTVSLYLLGYKREEIAKMLGKSAGDISNYKKRGFKKVREDLENELDL